MRNKVATVAALAVLFAAGYLVRSCVEPTPDERVAKLERQVLAATALVSSLESKNQQLLTQNSELDLKNKILEGESADKEAQISTLSARISELEAQEPSYPELESHPLVINLRAQIAEHKQRYSLAQEDIESLKGIIRNNKVQYNNLLIAYNNRGEALQATISAMSEGLSTSRELASENKKLKRWLKIGGYAIGGYASWKLLIQPLLR